MMRDWTSTFASYFTRSQKRTYPIDTAKKMMVIATYNASAMIQFSSAHWTERGVRPG